MLGLTPKQKQLYEYLKSYKGDVSPSYEEMAEAMGLASKSGVARMIDRLKERGYIENIPHQARTIRIRKRNEMQRMAVIQECIDELSKHKNCKAAALRLSQKLNREMLEKRV